MKLARLVAEALDQNTQANQNTVRQAGPLDAVYEFRAE